jgi:transcriptional regulator with XRE-family HTH domain
VVDSMDLANRLKIIRNNKGYSVYKLSQLSEISSTYIHEIEKSKKQPTVEVVSKLCRALDITLSEFFQEEIEKKTITLDEVIEELENLTPSQLEAIKLTAKTMKEK